MDNNCAIKLQCEVVLFDVIAVDFSKPRTFCRSRYRFWTCLLFVSQSCCSVCVTSFACMVFGSELRAAVRTGSSHARPAKRCNLAASYSAALESGGGVVYRDSCGSHNGTAVRSAILSGARRPSLALILEFHIQRANASSVARDCAQMRPTTHGWCLS